MDRPWADTEPDQLVARGHAAGDILEAWDWVVLSREPGTLRIGAHLPDSLRNPQGQLFGGFTPTYVDFVSIWCVPAGVSFGDAEVAGPAVFRASPSRRVPAWNTVTPSRASAAATPSMVLPFS